jgi:hypothetical protein
MKKRILTLSLVLLFLFFPIISSGCDDANSARSSYQINCTFSDNVLTGTEKVEFYNHTDNAIKELKFNLYGNAFRKGAKYSPIGAQYTSRAYPNGISYGEMKVNLVECDGMRVEFTIGGEDNNVLLIPLEKEIFPQERVLVTIEYTLTLANVIARTGYNSDTVNLANFYPILCGLDENGFYECVYYSEGDPYFSDCSDYDVTFTCQSKYTVASSGRLVSEKNVDGMVEKNYELENARSFAIVLSENFETITEIINGVEINYYFYDDVNPTASFEYVKKSMVLFNKTFGEYAYPTYSVVQTEFIQGGMEFPALVMISDQLEERAYGEVIVHETAHQWWQTTVGNNEIKYGFLDEGLAEYSVVLFYENYPEYGLDRKMLISSSEKTYKAFCSVYDKLFGSVDTSMLRSVSEFVSEYEYVNIAYVKPCIMYDNLRNTIGEQKFFSSLKNYYKNNALLNATPDSLVSEFEKQVKDCHSYFYSFFEGKAII